MYFNTEFSILSQYLDAPVMSSVYSMYVMLILFVITVATTSELATNIIGYLGWAVTGALVLLEIFFKCFYLPKY